MSQTIVGIDFGTANSGCAWCQQDNKEQFGNEILLVSLTGELGHTKVPTIIVLQREPPHETVAFGGAALHVFDPANHILFSQFKMQLYDNPDAQQIKSDIGEVFVDTHLVICRCLEHFKKEALDKIKLGFGRDVLPEEITWVVTIPAMWRESAKGTMRKAALMAGLISDAKSSNFMVAYEPECAALSVINQHMDKLENKDKYLVFDCGGGTIDVAIHKFTRSGDEIAIQELKAVRGLDNGSTRIDKLILKRLYEVFGQKIEKMNKVCSERFSFQANVMETAKQSWKEGGRLSLAVAQFSDEIATHCGSVSQAVNEYNKTVTDPVLRPKVVGQRLTLPSKFVQEIFDEIINPIEELAVELIEKNPGIKYVFVVGGFASSKYLRDKLESAIQRARSDARMLLVSNPSVAVVQGAVRYGINPDIVKKRCAHETIGVETQMDWSLNMPVEWREWEAETQSWKVKHCFSRLVQLGEQITSSKSIRRTFYPTSTESEKVTISFFSSASNTIPQLTTDEGVSKVGEVEIPVKPGVPVEENPVRIRVEVGGPQLLAYVKSAAMDIEQIKEFQVSS